VVLNFPPTGADLRTKIRNYKSIANCCTIIWMEQWPQEGYKQVAEAHLLENEVSNRDIIIGIAVNIHKEVMKIAKEYYLETQHYLYITPNGFSDFIKTYKKLFEEKRESLKTLQDRYETGLDRLKNT
jgi:dynein heavy chain